MRQTRKSVCVTGYGLPKKSDSETWGWTCEGCGKSMEELTKIVAGYSAERHRKDCLEVYTLAEREEDRLLELQVRKECLQKQISNLAKQ